MKQKLVIIGNGISGVTLARHIRKLSDNKITIISEESDYFFSRTALMYVFMGHMKFEHTQPYEPFFWKKNRIDLKKATVSSVDTASKKVVFDDNLMGGSTRSFSFFSKEKENDDDYLEWNGGETDASVEKIVKSIVSKIKSLQQKIEDTKPKETDKDEDE